MTLSQPKIADRNLLFGVLALQLNFIDPDALIAGMNAWALDKAKSLGQILCNQGVLSAGPYELLNAVVEEHVRQHQGDVEASLVAATAGSTVTQEFWRLAEPAVESTVSRLPPVPGRSIHRSPGGLRYCNLRPFAKGGLGQVFLADDTELNREVAVKEIQPHRADDPATRTRFLREATITGALEHPGVIPVYGLGVYPGGRPYYAMRLIRGESLRVAIDRYHSTGSPPKDAMALRQLLRRFIDVCNAVAYAHSRGVVHRDLKPQNVMLGPFGESLVVDWGLAKAGVDVHAIDAAADPTTDPAVRALGDDASPTTAGSVLGTLGYMSPEQASGQHERVGPLSDIFSLGATLYCLLTGKKPFAGDGIEDEITKTLKGQLVAAKALNPHAPSALDAICRKALSSDPAGRYPTALDLAADVERWLADEPVSVWRDSWSVRAIRWARRNRTMVAAVIATLIAAVIGLSIGATLLWREEKRTRNEFERAEREHRRAEGNFETARTTILEMGSRLDEAEAGVDSRQSDLKRKVTIDKARKEFEAFLAENPDDPAIKKQLAVLHRYAANVARLLGDYAEAESAYKASIAIWEDLSSRHPGDASHRDNLALTLGDSATVQKRGGRLKAAAETLDRAAALAEEIKQSVPLSFYQRTLAKTLIDRADVEYRLGNFATAEDAAGHAVALAKALKEAPSEEARAIDPLLVVMSLQGRATALLELGNEADALKLLDDAIARLELLGGANGSRDVRHLLNKSRLDRAVAWSRTDAKKSDALIELGTVIENGVKQVDLYRQAAIYREVLIRALIRRGELYTGSKSDLAAADFDRALIMTRELLDNFGQQPDYAGLRARAYMAKGRLLIAEGKKPEAGTAFDSAVVLFKFARRKDPDNFHFRRGLEAAEQEAKANPKPGGPMKP